MADDPSSNLRAYDRHCYNGTCHCDWRLSIYDCVESKAMWYVNVLNIAISALVIIFGIILLTHRILIKGHSLWTPSGPNRGILRPKPVDSMLASLVIFNSLRLVTSVSLIADVAKGNWIAKSYLFEMPWIFGIGAITLYLIGIAQTISQSHSAEGWLPSPGVVDAFGITALLLPLVVGNPLTLAGGAVADSGDPETGINLIRINYGTWFIWTGGLGIAVLYAAIRLVHILRAHHKRFRQASNYAAVKNGIYKIQMMAFSFVICLWCFATVLLLFAAIRDQILANTAGNIIVGAAWNFLGCVTTLIVQIAVIFSPGMRSNAALRSKSSSGGGGGGKGSNNGTSNTTRPDLIWGTTTTMDPSATGTFDQEAIMEALKHNDGGKPWLQEQPQRGKNAKNFKIPQRRSSETSSQLELTSYEQQ